jgi:hypothetical protein
VSSTSEQAKTVVRGVLARAAGMNALLWGFVGVALLTPGGLCIAQVFHRLDYAGYLGDSGEQCLLASVPLILAGLYCFVVKGIRSFGARGTRVGRITLDFPTRASVQPIVRRITVNGVPVRDAHLVSVTVDAGDMLEIQVSPTEMSHVLAAFAAWCGPMAVNHRVLDMTGAT